MDELDYGEGKTRQQEAVDSAFMLGMLLFGMILLAIFVTIWVVFF